MKSKNIQLLVGGGIGLAITAIVILVIRARNRKFRKENKRLALTRDEICSEAERFIGVPRSNFRTLNKTTLDTIQLQRLEECLNA